jgi:hypothetical protein
LKLDVERVEARRGEAESGMRCGGVLQCYGAEGSGGGWPIMEFNSTGFGNEMGRGVDDTPS